MCIHVHWKHSKLSMHQYFIVFPQLLAIQCVWQYGFIWQLNFLFSSSLWHSVFSLSLCLWGSKVCQLCSGSTCSTAICIFIFTFIVADNAGLSASACRGNELCNKKRTSCTRGRLTERERGRTVFLLPYAKDSTVASQLEARASKLSNLFLPNETEMKCLFCGLACLWYVLHATLWNPISWQS